MEHAVYVSEVLDAIECSKKMKAYKRRGRNAVVTNKRFRIDQFYFCSQIHVMKLHKSYRILAALMREC